MHLDFVDSSIISEKKGMENDLVKDWGVQEQKVPHIQLYREIMN